MGSMLLAGQASQAAVGQERVELPRAEAEDRRAVATDQLQDRNPDLGQLLDAGIPSSLGAQLTDRGRCCRSPDRPGRRSSIGLDLGRGKADHLGHEGGHHAIEVALRGQAVEAGQQGRILECLALRRRRAFVDHQAAQVRREPGGTQAAIADCQAFILGRIGEAIAGLDATGQPDPTNRTTLTVYLSLRGQVNAPLPTYYVKMGQAIHAIEDSFTHTYRTPDSTKITVTLNWIDKVGGNLVESRDGPAHAAQLDRCDDPDALRTARHALAVKAAVGVLTATLDPQMSSDQKMAAAGAVLTTYLSYSPGCTYDNGWCNAPERAYADSSCGCHVGTVHGTLGATIAAGVLAFIAVARRARRRSRRRLAGALGAAAALLLATGDARAQSTTPTSTAPTTTTSTTPSGTTSTTTIPASTPGTPPTTATTVTKPLTTTTILTAPTQPDEHAPPPPKVVPVPEPGPRDPSATAWGGFVGGSGSISNPALAGTAGVRLRASKSWAFGLDGEWNPWIALNGVAFHASVVNVYGTAILRLPLAYENFNLRSTVSLGTSYLLSSLYGAPSGSLGLYGGLSFLGLEWKVSRTFYAIINPLGVVLPVPQLKGVPLMYPQYRFTLGLEFYLD